MESRLSPLQVRVLRVLAPLEPPWALTGGGALVGFHLGHRRTKDVDLFFHGQRLLGTVPDEAIGLLASDGLAVRVDRRAPAFTRLVIGDGVETGLADLVAEPMPNVEPPARRSWGTSLARSTRAGRSATSSTSARSSRPAPISRRPSRPPHAKMVASDVQIWRGCCAR